MRAPASAPAKQCEMVCGGLRRQHAALAEALDAA